MLDWLLGKSAEGTGRDKVNDELPETPAPVFAARAIKSAIFGTPAPPPDDSIFQKLEERASMAQRTEGSPIKPQGILMTPGTARTRKTVSFGQNVYDNKVNPNSKSGIPDDCPGKFPSPWVPRDQPTDGESSTRKTALTRSLEKVREARKKQDQKVREPSKLRIMMKEDERTEEKDEESDKARLVMDTPKPLRQIEVDTGLTEPQLDDAVKKAVQRSKARESARQTQEAQLQSRHDETEDDYTLDFNKPRSQSGRFWKEEFDHYHKEAHEQMVKLVKYKNLAKNYAKKRDQEANELAEKLEEEQQRVFEMEDRIAELVSHIARNSSDGKDDSDDLVNLLAKQTTLALRYRKQVEKFQKALQERDSPDKKQPIALGDNGKPRLLVAGDTKLREMEELRKTMHTLQNNLATTEKKAATLEEEKAKLLRDLSRTKEDLGQSEKRREIAEANADDSNRRFKELQDTYTNLKEAAKKQRREAESLLKRRHDQVSELRKEILSMKGQLGDHGVRGEVDEGLAQERRPGRASEFAPRSRDAATSAKTRPTQTLNVIRAATEIPLEDRTVFEDNETKVPVLEGSMLRPRRASERSERLSRPKEERRLPRPRSTTVLAELTNKQAENEQPVVKDSDFDLRKRFTALSNGRRTDVRSNGTGKNQLSSRALPARVPASPRPSMYTYSPVKDDANKAASRYEPFEEISNRADRPSRFDSMASTRSRTTLDPDRAAAAKARIERRNAEKRRLRESAGGTVKGGGDEVQHL